MTEPLRPTAALSLGRKNWLYVPSGGFANYKAPTATELSAASVLDFTNMAMQDGTSLPTASTNRVQGNRRVGDTSTPERKGIRTYQGGSLVYAIDPQAITGADAIKAWEKFLGGPEGGFIVNRLNVQKAVAVATGQRVTVWPADLGESIEGETGSDDAGEFSATCDYFIRDFPATRVALV